MNVKRSSEGRRINPKSLDNISTKEQFKGHRLTQEDRVKGGKASAIARNDRKTFREDLLLMLSTGDTQQKVNLALLQKALEGDIRAFEVLRDTVGERPTDKVEQDTKLEIVSDLQDWAR